MRPDTPVFLRSLTPEDAAAVLSAFASAPDMDRQGKVTSIGEAEAYISAHLAPESANLVWAIASTHRLVGLVCMQVDKKNLSGWVSYWMHADERGRGLTSRALATVADWALGEGGIERLELGHRVNNPASGAVARAAGFVKEGTERAKFRICSERVDVDTYARLRSDPQPIYSPLACVLPSPSVPLSKPFNSP